MPPMPFAMNSVRKTIVPIQLQRPGRQLLHFSRPASKEPKKIVIWLIWFVSFVWLHETNQIDKTDWARFGVPT